MYSFLLYKKFVTTDQFSTQHSDNLVLYIPNVVIRFDCIYDVLYIEYKVFPIRNVHFNNLNPIFNKNIFGVLYIG